MKKLIAIMALAAVSGSALASDWREVGDAGALPPGQVTIGPGALTSITGKLEGQNGNVIDFEDMYCIRITNPTGFRATTIGGAAFDTQLFLFDMAGRGISHNDDSAGGFLSTLTGQFVPATGLYHIAITGYNRDPVDVAGGLIWNNSPFGTERAPDGPAAANAIAGWSGNGATGDYVITLEGAEFCRVPAPGAMALLGLGGLAAARRRRV